MTKQTITADVIANLGTGMFTPTLGVIGVLIVLLAVLTTTFTH